MHKKSEFVENLNEVFALFGPIRAKRMFGGYGLYRDDLMFALVADDVLYLKADVASEGRFRSLGLSKFEYLKKGRKMQMSYYQAPEELFDDPEQAKTWAELAFDAALRSKKKVGPRNR